MRYQDRLLKALGHPDLHYRAFVARQLERVVVHFDSEDVVSTVRTSWHEAAGPMALHFLCTFNDLFPRHLRSVYAPGQAPVRSQFLSAAGKIGQGSRARPEGRDAIARSATHVLEPCILALKKRFEASSGRERRVLLTTLARFHHGAVESLLAERLADDAEGPLAAFLLAGPFCTLDDSRLLGRLEKLMAKEVLPQYLLALRYVPSEATFEFLRKASDHGTPAVQWVTAQCLDHFSRFELAGVVETLFAGQFGWAIAHALETIGRIGIASWGREFVTRALEKFEHPLVRTTALRALVTVGGADALELCLHEIEKAPSPHSLAQALSSLIQLGAPPELRARVCSRLVKHPFPEAATQAILGLIGADSALAGKAIRDLIVEGAEDDRVQAAYCLGYYPGESTVRVLDHQVRTDPSASVRLQAVRAFSYFERTPAITSRLLSYLDLEDERVAIDALRILSTPGAVDESAVADGIGAVARYGATASLRRLAARALGRFSNRLARAFIQETLTSKSADADTLLGAVEGMGWAEPPAPELDGLRGLLDHGVPTVRTAAARVLFTWGDLTGVDLLAKMIEGSGAEAREACRAMEEVATIVDFLLAEPRFSSLAEQLRANLRASGYLEFSRRELGLVASPEQPEEGVDPHASVLTNRPAKAEGLGEETAGRVLADIDAALSRFPSRRPARLKRMTREEKLPLPGPEDRLAIGGGRPRPWMMAALGVLLGLVAFGVYFLTSRDREVEPASAASTTTAPPVPMGQGLAVASARGDVKVERGGPGSGEPVAAEAQLMPGQRIVAGKSASVRLGSQPPGNTLILLGEGGFTFDGLDVESAERRAIVLRVSGVTGQLVLDLKWGRPRAELALGGFKVKGWKGQYAVQSTPGACAVKVAAGRVEITDKLGQFTLVTEGQKMSWKPGAEKGEVSAFDPTGESWK